jgi:hypothetical protein
MVIAVHKPEACQLAQHVHQMCINFAWVRKAPHLFSVATDFLPFSAFLCQQQFLCLLSNTIIGPPGTKREGRKAISHLDKWVCIQQRHEDRVPVIINRLQQL